tara:strand:- start:1566 stop:2369 length:804 start_codon:yes stop_codon:yes gene_type:complete
MSLKDGRPEFVSWVDAQNSPPNWQLLPLTHITRGLAADDILRSGKVEPSNCDTLEGAFAFFFYGRPAYRVNRDKVIKLEVSCPYCFIFSPTLISRANKFYAFDTGAFGSRLYSHVLDDEFSVEDFALSNDPDRLNKLVSAVFGDQIAYYDADRTKMKGVSEVTEPHDHAARAYIELLRSPGRNEPDDRICSIEVVFADPVTLHGNVMAIVVPHTIFDARDHNPLLSKFIENSVDILPYSFVPNRHPEHYQTLMESEILAYYKLKGIV